MIHVVAMLTTQPGQRAKVLQAFNANAVTVRQEDGCIEYVATVDVHGLPASPGTVGDDTFVVVEKWASLDALKAHGAAPHMKAYATSVKGLMAQRVIHILEPAPDA